MLGVLMGWVDASSGWGGLGPKLLGWILKKLPMSNSDRKTENYTQPMAKPIPDLRRQLFQIVQIWSLLGEAANV